MLILPRVIFKVKLRRAVVPQGYDLNVRTERVRFRRSAQRQRQQQSWKVNTIVSVTFLYVVKKRLFHSFNHSFDHSWFLILGFLFKKINININIYIKIIGMNKI